MDRDRQRGRRLAAEDGAISVMAGVLIVAMIMATSLAVDVGRVAYTSRDQQGVTDRSVLDALRSMPDNIADGLSIEETHAAITDSVNTTLSGNTEGSSVGTAHDRGIENIEIGYTHPDCVYDPGDPQPDDPADFCLMYSDFGAGPAYDPGKRVTTVRVITHSTVDYVFAFLDEEGHRDVYKEAIGSVRRIDDDCVPPDTECPVDAEAMISVRSRLVELNTANSALNEDRLAIVREMVGDLIDVPTAPNPPPTSVTAAGFDGLATADVPLSVLGDAGATVGTTQQLLDSHVTLTDLFTAMASGATSDDAAVTAEAQTALATLAAEADSALTVRIGDFITTTTEDPAALLTAQVKTLDLVMHAAINAAVANGNHFIDVDLAGGTLGDPLFALDGLLEVDGTLEIIEGPQMAQGKAAIDPATGEYVTVARTAQVNFEVDVELNTYYAEELLGPLEDLISGLLCDVIALLDPALCDTEVVPIDIPAIDAGGNVSVADAEAALTEIECLDPLRESDLTTIVTSDALVASVSGGDETLVDSRGPSDGTVFIDTVPGEGDTTIDNTVSATNIPAVDEYLETVFGLLGIDLGTARVASHEILCDVPVLLENPL